MLKKGNITLGAIPQMPGHGDWLVCGISSKLYHEVIGFDEKIIEDGPDFSKTGLKKASLIRLGFLATLPENRIKGLIGSLSRERARRLVLKLSNHISNAVL